MPLQFELSKSILGIYRDGHTGVVPWESGPPPRIDGYIVGLVAGDPSRPPRHAGERHPDADEVLVLISGAIDVLMEDESGGESVHPVRPGEVIVVPKGVWHRVVTREPGQLLHITPGPQGEWRRIAQE